VVRIVLKRRIKVIFFMGRFLLFTRWCEKKEKKERVREKLMVYD